MPCKLTVVISGIGSSNDFFLQIIDCLHRINALCIIDVATWFRISRTYSYMVMPILSHLLLYLQTSPIEPTYIPSSMMPNLQFYEGPLFNGSLDNASWTNSHTDCSITINKLFNDRPLLSLPSCENLRLVFEVGFDDDYAGISESLSCLPNLRHLELELLDHNLSCYDSSSSFEKYVAFYLLEKVIPTHQLLSCFNTQDKTEIEELFSQLPFDNLRSLRVSYPVECLTL